ncbi:PLBD2 [Symbiodinium microadriaticum]|nr:PLBD2 [Symbiodinium microadriaticum]
MDPPITTRGKSLAKFQGQTLTELCNKLGTPIDVVITSPFHRCVQTAAAIIEVLPMRNGKKVPILIDCEIAEVGLYKKPPGISDPGLIKAHQEFCSRRRTFDEVAALPDLQGIEKLNANSFDMRKEEGSTAARAVSEPLGGTAPTMASRSRPLAEYVRFETKEGTVLLYEPHPLDSWINRECAWDNRKQVYMDLATGDKLTDAESEDYQRYLQRHKERRHAGGQADELVKLAAKINPRTVVELRFYIAKFPWEVSRLLGEGKVIYKEMSKQRHGGETAQTAVLQKEEKLDKQKRKKAKVGKTTKEKHSKKKAKHDTTEGEDLPSASAAVEPAEKTSAGDTENEVDWGGSDVDDKQPTTASPHDAGGNRDDDNPITSDTMSQGMSWPWGERGRPSDTASSDSMGGVGIAPPFPEQRRSAHIRGLYRFAEWLERGRYARLNFLIVTHQDLVHTFCSMIKPEVCIEWVKYCGWGAAFVKRKDFGNLSADAIQKRSTKPPPPLHSLQITSELGSGVRWSPYTVDPRTGNHLRWYPAEDETGVAAIAAIFSNQQSTELQEMKRYADTQALQRAFRGGKTFSLIMSAANSRSENELEDSVRDKPPSTEDIDIAKLEISDAYEKVMLNSTVMEPPKRSTSEEEMARGVHPNLTPLFNVKASFDRKNIDKLKGLSATLDNETNQIVLVNAVQDHAVSWARLADRLSETGWMELHVSTPKSAFFSNDLKMYSAGIVEGYLTAERMSQFYSNFYPLLQPNEDSTLAMMNIRNSFNQQIQHIMRMCKLAAGTAEGEPADPYWKHVRYLFLQMWGLKDAYNLVAAEKVNSLCVEQFGFAGYPDSHCACNRKGVRTIDMVDLLFMNSHAELPELIEAFRPQAVAARSGAASSDDAPDSQNSTSGSLLEAHASQADALTIDSDWKLRLAKHGHCTALVRLAPANSDLFIGHTTWGDYSKMSRVYKYYRFDLPLSFQSHELMGFSSYPGCVSSTDDFYMMDNGLAVMDTTLEVLNPKLYSRVMDDPDRPRLPKFLHVMAVNRVAKTGTQWTSMMAEQNTGTGNSQWIVVDYNRFSPGQPLQRNTLRIVEQVPGMTHQADITTELTSRGYWGSFNRPFFEDIRRMSGHKTAEESYGKLFSFEDSPRASLLRRFGSGVSQLGDMRSTMTRNDPKDAVPGFPAGPGHAIMARLDLDAMVNNIPNGGIDAKVTSACLFKRMACQAVSGPSHGSYPAFRWTSQATDTAPAAELFQGWPHLGLPDVWDFDFVEMSSDEDKLASSQLSDSC